MVDHGVSKNCNLGTFDCAAVACEGCGCRDKREKKIISRRNGKAKTPEIRIRSGHRTGAPRARRSHCFTHTRTRTIPLSHVHLPDQPEGLIFDTLLCGFFPRPELPTYRFGVVAMQSSQRSADLRNANRNNPNATTFQLEMIDYQNLNNSISTFGFLMYCAIWHTPVQIGTYEVIQYSYVCARSPPFDGGVCDPNKGSQGIT